MKIRLSQDAWIVVLLIIFAAVAMSIAGGEQQEESGIIPIRTTFSASPTGIRAIYDTLHKLGYPVARQTTPLTNTPPDGVLFIISPKEKISPEEWRHVEKWVERGNLLFIVRGSDLSEELDEVHITNSTPAVPSFLSPGVGKISTGEKSSVDDVTWNFENESRSHKSHGPALVTLFGTDIDNSIAYSACGRGGVLAFSDAYMFSNKNIGSADNLILILNAVEHQKKIGLRQITFDEFHQGYGSHSGGLLSLIGVPAKLGLLQLFAAFILLVFAGSRRFGRPVPLREGVRTRNEYLRSMSMLIRKARATSAVRVQLERHFLDEIARMIGLPPNADEANIEDAMKVRRPDKVEKFRKLLSASHASESESSLFALEIERSKFRKELIG